jgi:hypothetical protein
VKLEFETLRDSSSIWRVFEKISTAGAAIDADGRGHFLAMYDGEEIELANAYAYQI